MEKKKKSLVTFFLDCVSEFSTACTSAWTGCLCFPFQVMRCYIIVKKKKKNLRGNNGILIEILSLCIHNTEGSDSLIMKPLVK